ncbi:MAG: OB-fold domain-containing protein [Acidobacteriota bacterium]|nr:OB-fold domain-containing protein [Acidobacteriota bacterium]
MRTGIVYTETVLHMDPPYQVVIVTLDGGGRVTARAAVGERLAIDDLVVEAEAQNGIPCFRKSL